MAASTTVLADASLNFYDAVMGEDQLTRIERLRVAIWDQLLRE